MASRSPVLGVSGDEFSWSLLDAAPDTVLVVSSKGQIVFANQHGADLFGYSPEQLLDTPVDELLPAAVRSAHRAHRTRYRAEPTERRMGEGRRLWARRSDDSEFPVDVSLSPILIGGEMYTVAAVRDISERVRADDDLQRVLHTLDACDDGVFIFDAVTLRYSYVNDGAVRLTGYSRAELLTMSPLHLNPDARRAEYHELIERLGAHPDQAIARQTMLQRKDGEELAVEKSYQCAPRGHDGTEWIITLTRDSTARLKVEEDLRHSAEALHDAEQVMVVAEDRERIARDLHDNVIQRLFAAGLNLQATIALTDGRVSARLEATITDLDDTIKELRMAIFSLHGSGVTIGGVRGRLLEVLREAGATLGFEPRLQFEGAIETIDDVIVDQLVPTLRESLSNVARHAQATGVRVSLIVADMVLLTVIDDGIAVSGGVVGGEGLSNMAHRAEALGGCFEMTPEPGQGTRIVWQVPCEPEAPALTLPVDGASSGVATSESIADSIAVN